MPSTPEQIFNVKDYGAVGNGVADDTAEIQAAIDAASAVGGSTVYFPNGTYLVSKVGTDGGCVYPKTGTRLRGESITGSIIKLAASQANFTRPIVVTGVTDVSISVLSVDGNKANQAVNEHRAAIFTENCSRVHISDMELKNNTGDGVHVHANGTTDWSQDVVIERCNMHDNDRKGVSCTGGALRRVTIRDCWFVNNYGAVHVETQQSPQDVAIEHCWCDRNAGNTGIAVSFSGGGTSNKGQGASLVDCTIKGGVQVAWYEGVTIARNRIEVDPSGGVRPVVILFDSQHIVVDGNDLTVPSGAGAAIDAVVYVQGGADSGSYYQPTDIVITGNRVRSGYEYCNGITLVNAGDVSIRGNTLKNTRGTSSSAATGVAISATISQLPTKSILIEGNFFSNWYQAAQASGTTTIASVVIADNRVEGAGNPSLLGAWNLNYNNNNPLQKCSVLGNELVSTMTAFIAYPTVPVLIGGTRGGRGIYSCNGTPEGVITELVGAMALRRDGGAGTTPYFKESGTGATGWVAK